MAAHVQLDRPAAAQVAFDYKTGRTSRGWPLEHIKSGTLEGLAHYLCFYATRAARPELVGPTQSRLGLDEDFCAIILTMFPCFSAASALVGALRTVWQAKTEAGDALASLHVCDVLSLLVDPATKYLLWLQPQQQVEMLREAQALLEDVAAAMSPAAAAFAAAATAGASSTGAAVFAGGASAGASVDLALADAVVLVDRKLALARLAVDIASAEGMAHPAPPVQTLQLLTSSMTGAASAASDVGAATGGDGAAAAVSATGAAAGAASVTSRPPLAVAASSRSASSGVAATSVASGTSPAVPPPLPAFSPVASLWSVPYASFAAQWTHVEYALFRGIPMSEWLGCGWDKPRYEHAADAIRRGIDHFNAMTLWVTAEVLSGDTPRARAATIVRFAKLGVALRAYNNFAALAELSMALRRDCVARLVETWSLVPPAARECLTSIFATMDDKKNYRAYKEALRGIAPGTPMVPHLGAHTSEITMQDQLLPSTIPASSAPGAPEWLHVRRYRELYKLIMPLVAMQETGYEGTTLPAAAPSVINLLNHVVRPYYFAFDEDRDAAVARMEQRSLDIEPPEDDAADATAAASDGADGTDGGGMAASGGRGVTGVRGGFAALFGGGPRAAATS